MEICRDCGKALRAQSVIGRRREFCDSRCRNRFHGVRRRLVEETVRLADEVAVWRERIRLAPLGYMAGWERRNLESYERKLAEAEAELAAYESRHVTEGAV